jgi:perosamine synthetase
MITMGVADIGKNEKKYVMNVLKRKQLSYGLYSQRFEKQFAEVHKCKYGVLMNSGTDALRIAFATLKEVHKWKDGDEVICPAVTFVASANIILQTGLRPRFVDVNRCSFNIDPTCIAKQITMNTKALLTVHLFGLPAEMDSIMTLAAAFGLNVVEDSCETMLVKKDGYPVGSFGDIACFSTYVAHLITTGVGGLATTNSAVYADIMRSYANHGRDPKYLGGSFGHQHIGNRASIRHRFLFHRIGYSSRATEMEAALGLAQLERLPEIIRRRQKVADALLRDLSAKGLRKHLQLPIYETAESARMMFPLVLRRDNKWKLMEHLEKAGIETRELMPLLSQPCYKHLGYKLSDYPVAELLHRRGLYIPCHQLMSTSDIAHIVETFERFYRG